MTDQKRQKHHLDMALERMIQARVHLALAVGGLRPTDRVWEDQKRNLDMLDLRIARTRELANG